MPGGEQVDPPLSGPAGCCGRCSRVRAASRRCCRRPPGRRRAASPWPSRRAPRRIRRRASTAPAPAAPARRGRAAPHRAPRRRRRYGRSSRPPRHARRRRPRVELQHRRQAGAQRIDPLGMRPDPQPALPHLGHRAGGAERGVRQVGLGEGRLQPPHGRRGGGIALLADHRLVVRLGLEPGMNPFGLRQIGRLAPSARCGAAPRAPRIACSSRAPPRRESCRRAPPPAPPGRLRTASVSTSSSLAPGPGGRTMRPKTMPGRRRSCT
jgi:hypothetical protein